MKVLTNIIADEMSKKIGHNFLINTDKSRQRILKNTAKMKSHKSEKLFRSIEFRY